MSQPTSFRLPPGLVKRIDEEAAQRGMTMTRLVSSLLDEGLKTSRFAGVVYRDGPSGRRAGLAGGPDVWEVVRAVRASQGRGEARVQRVAQETEIPERLVHLAIEFAAAYPDEVDERIRLDEEAAEHLRGHVRARERLLGM
ncbi:hypothetical protein BH23CHL8_BH23CHL8_20840 [soil metagenome]